MRSILLGGILWAATCFTYEAHAACSLRAPPISLGTYDPLNAAPPPVLVSIEVSCRDMTSVSVSAGRGASRNYNARTLTMGMETVSYNLYTGTNQAFIWGDGTFGTQVVRAVINPNEPVQIIGNASIFPGQNPQTGLYTDTLIFTLSF